MTTRHATPVTQFVDKFGDTRLIHRNRNGVLAVSREGSTVILALTDAIGRLTGQNIRKARLAAQMTMPELCERAGLKSVSPKSRIYEIEHNYCGIRFGTLYALAAALETTPQALLPSLEEALAEAGVQMQASEQLSRL